MPRCPDAQMPRWSTSHVHSRILRFHRDLRVFPKTVRHRSATNNTDNSGQRYSTKPYVTGYGYCGMPSVLTTPASGHDSQRLAPEDALYNLGSLRPLTTDGTLGGRKRRERTRSASRRRKGNYKKLLWFKQPCK